MASSSSSSSSIKSSHHHFSMILLLHHPIIFCFLSSLLLSQEATCYTTTTTTTFSSPFWHTRRRNKREIRRRIANLQPFCYCHENDYRYSKVAVSTALDSTKSSSFSSSNDESSVSTISRNNRNNNFLIIDLKAVFQTQQIFQAYNDELYEQQQHRRILSDLINWTNNDNNQEENAVILFVQGDDLAAPAAFHVPQSQQQHQEEKENNDDFNDNGGVAIVFTGQQQQQQQDELILHQLQHYFLNITKKDKENLNYANNHITLVTNHQDLINCCHQSINNISNYNNTSTKNNHVNNIEIMDPQNLLTQIYKKKELQTTTASNDSTLLSQKDIESIVKYIEAVHNLHHTEKSIRRRSTRLQRKLQKKVNSSKETVNPILVAHQRKKETSKGERVDGNISIQKVIDYFISSIENNSGQSDRDMQTIMSNKEEEEEEEMKRNPLYRQIHDERIQQRKKQQQQQKNNYQNYNSFRRERERQKEQFYYLYNKFVQNLYKELTAATTTTEKVNFESSTNTQPDNEKDTRKLSIAKQYVQYINSNIKGILQQVPSPPKKKTRKVLSKPKRPIRLVVISDTHGYEMALTPPPSQPSSSSSSSSDTKKKSHGKQQHKQKTKDQKILEPWFPIADVIATTSNNYNGNNLNKYDTIQQERTDEEQLLLPPGDVLLHLGDFSIDKPPPPTSKKKKTKKSSSNKKSAKKRRCPQQIAHTKFDTWLSKQHHTHKFILRGNHDPLHVTFPKSNAKYISSQTTIINVEGWILRLIPYTRYHKLAMLRSSSGGGGNNSVNDPCHVLATHEPPHGYLDRSILGTRERVGSKTLLRYIQEEYGGQDCDDDDDDGDDDRPMYWFCGHIHEGRGLIETSFDRGGVNKNEKTQKKEKGKVDVERERLFLSSSPSSLGRKKSSVMQAGGGKVGSVAKPSALSTKSTTTTTTTTTTKTKISSTVLSSSSVDDDNYETDEKTKMIKEGNPNRREETNSKQKTILINASNANPGPARCLHYGPVIVDLVHEEYEDG